MSEKAKALAEAHDQLVRSLADTGFNYLHIDWHKCACEDAVLLRSLMDEEGKNG